MCVTTSQRKTNVTEVSRIIRGTIHLDGESCCASLCHIPWCHCLDHIFSMCFIECPSNHRISCTMSASECAPWLDRCGFLVMRFRKLVWKYFGFIQGLWEYRDFLKSNNNYNAAFAMHDKGRAANADSWPKIIPAVISTNERSWHTSKLFNNEVDHLHHNDFSFKDGHHWSHADLMN